MKAMHIATALALASLVMVTAAQAPATTAVQLPPLPDSIPSMLGYVKVIRTTGLMCNNQPAYGCYSNMQRVIWVRDSMPAIISRIALEHERKHMEFADGAIRFASEEEEDRVCDILARARVLEMLAALR